MGVPKIFKPRVIGLLGFGEAGSAIAHGLCTSEGWRDGAADRYMIAIDIALGCGIKGRTIASKARHLDLPISSVYDAALNAADLVISVVTGTESENAALMARDFLRPGALYADFNTTTGPQTKKIGAAMEAKGVDFVDVAVMGSFKAVGHRIPLLISGPRAEDMANFSASIGAPTKVLSQKIGDASAVKILRSILIKGIEALSVEFLVAARRQGLVDPVLNNLGDVDSLGLGEFIKIMTVTHLSHAKRRMEEVEKAIENLEQTEVPILMGEAIRRSHARTVNANIEPHLAENIDLDTAIKILDDFVMTPKH